MADYLSRLELGEPVETVYNDLPNANIFGIDTATPNAEMKDEWIKEMMHFLNVRLPPDHLSLDVKIRTLDMTM